MSLLARTLTALAAVLLLAVGLSMAAWVLAYGVGPSFEGEARVPGLGAAVTVTHDESGTATVEARSEEDLMAGLGYAHALHSAWPMALWRQTATGALSQWFDDESALGLDRHATALGFGAEARASYAALPEADRAVLDAYARGVNAAFERDRLGEGDAFVLLGVDAGPWRPWDALAVERLVAYLATPAPALPDSTARRTYRANPRLGRFVAADSAFRSMLGVGGLEHSLAFAVPGAGGTTLVQRLVYGSSALPLVQEVVLRQGGRQTLVASVPGTLMLPSGYAADRAWSLFLNGEAAFVSAPVDSAALTPSFDRIVAQNGGETLVTTYRAPGALYLYDPAAPRRPGRRDSTRADSVAADLLSVDSLGVDSLAADATWQVRWRGFGAGTDLGAWRALLRGGAATFSLVPGAGVLLEGGQVRVLGSPAVVRALPGGVFAGADASTEAVADRVALLAVDSAGAGDDGLLADAYSAWAAALAPPLIGALGGPDEVPAGLRDAAAYLRGWDFRYDPASIGATIFEAWLTAHRDRTGALPDPDSVALPPLPPDSLGNVAERPAVASLKRSLRRAVSDLNSTQGREGAGWRWQTAQRAVRSYPLFGTDTTEAGRFAPVLVPEGGHPTAIAWGPSAVFPAAASAAAWSAQATMPGAADLLIRHRVLAGETARALAVARPVAPRAVRWDAPAEHTLRLLPAED